MRRAVFARAALERTPGLAELTAALAPLDRPFLLHGRWGGAPRAGQPVIVAGAEPYRRLLPGEDPFAVVRELPVVEGDLPPGAVGGGIAGWFGFGCATLAERTAGPWPPRTAPVPTAQLAWYSDVLRRDEHGIWWAEALLDPDGEATIDTVVERWRRRLDAGPPQPAGRLSPLTVHRGPAAHRAAVAEAIERIGAGELFQANICLRLDGTVDGHRSALVAPVLEQTQPWYGGWIEGEGDAALISASPELFLRRTGRAVATGPIKGTAPRVPGSESPADDPVAGALLASPKDRAEHVMIVDLMRNDLGRVCDYGTVVADPAPTVEPHAAVWHLTSTVRGTLHPTLDDSALLRASFPPGSVTGAPKVQAVRVIAALEGSAREAYTGAHGLISPVSGLELAVTIRTLEFSGRRAWLGAGGGIVADSDPARELDEALRKASGIAAAAGSTVVVGADDPADAPAGVPWIQSADRRPDPSAGLLETLRAGDDGVPVRATEHLARLRTSAAALGFGEIPVDAASQLTALAAQTAPGDDDRRLRLQLTPHVDGTSDLTFRRALLGAPGGEVMLEPAIVPGGLGPHKWADRGLVDALTARLGATPLLLDADGTVLEAGWANVWWLDGEQLCTPPADGRLLPGVTRGAVFGRAAELGIQTTERRLRFDDTTAELPLLLSSARGVSIGRLRTTSDQALRQAGELAALLAGV